MINVRETTINDFVDVRELILLLAKSYPDAYVEGYKKLKSYSEEEWNKILKDPNKKSFVAEQLGMIIGFVQVINEKNQSTSPHISTMGVIPRFKGKGVGYKLLERAIKYVTGKGYESVHLYVLSDQKESVNFYKSNGFKVQEILKGDIMRHDGSWQDVLVMKKLLSV